MIFRLVDKITLDEGLDISIDSQELMNIMSKNKKYGDTQIAKIIKAILKKNESKLSQKGKSDLFYVLQKVLKDRYNETNYKNAPEVKFLTKVPDQTLKADDIGKKLNFLFTNSPTGKVDLNKDFYSKVSLYDRDVNDFAYTVNALELITNPFELRSLGVNPSSISINDLSVGGKIMSANRIRSILSQISTQQDIAKESGKEFTLFDYLKKYQKDMFDSIFNSKEPIDNRISLFNDFLANKASERYKKIQTDYGPKKLIEAIGKLFDNKIYNNIGITKSEIKDEAKVANKVLDYIKRNILSNYATTSTRKQ